MITLDKKIIVVTGGEGLLGKAIVQQCREMGATVVSADISLKPNADLTQIGLDISDEASIKACMEAVVKHHGRIDGLVNSAYPRTADWSLPFEEIPAESFKKNFGTHLLGYILCCREVLERMKKQGSGSVVNIGSIYGVVAPDFSIYEGTSLAKSPAAYAAIKGGLIQMSRYLASYYGKQNIRVNAVSPGGIFDKHPDEFVQKYSQRTMLGRMAKQEDIAPTVAFLLSDSASYITGQNILVDGGWSAL